MIVRLKHLTLPLAWRWYSLLFHRFYDLTRTKAARNLDSLLTSAIFRKRSELSGCFVPVIQLMRLVDLSTNRTVHLPFAQASCQCFIRAAVYDNGEKRGWLVVFNFTVYLCYSSENPVCILYERAFLISDGLGVFPAFGIKLLVFNYLLERCRLLLACYQ